MTEYHFPIPKSVIKADLRRLRDHSIPFENRDAIKDLVILDDEGKSLSQQKLADRWGWTRGMVRERISHLKKEALKWRRFGKENYADSQPNNNPTTTQQQPDHNPNNGQYELESADHNQGTTQQQPDHNQSTTKPDLIHTRATYSDTNTNHIKKPSSVKRPKKARVDWESIYTEVVDSWNEFAVRASEHSAKDIPKVVKLNDKRKKYIRQRYKQIREHLDEIYAKAILWRHGMGFNDRTWVINFDFLWDTRGKWLEILERTFDRPQEPRKPVITDGLEVDSNQPVFLD